LRLLLGGQGERVVADAVEQHDELLTLVGLEAGGGRVGELAPVILNTRERPGQVLSVAGGRELLR